MWRFDPDSAALVAPVQLDAAASLDRRHALVQIGNYLLEWGPVQLKPYGGLFPYRLFMFDPNNGNPLGTGAKTVVQMPWGPQTVSTSVQKGSWPK